MDVCCEYLKDGKTGVFRLEGRKSFEDAKEVWEKVKLAIHDDNLKRVLMFDNSVSQLKLYEVIDLVKHMKEISFPSDIKIAIVDPRSSMHSNNAFGETVAHNRMWQLIFVFNDEASARAWLNEQSV